MTEYHNNAWDYDIEAGDELNITIDYRDGGDTVDGSMTAASDKPAGEGQKINATDSNGRTHELWFADGTNVDPDEAVAYIRAEDGTHVHITRMEVA